MTDSKEYNILVIEDNPGDFILIEDLLFEQISRPIITHADCCKTAIEILTGDCKFDVILLDLSLPDNTGECLIIDIAQLCNNIPIIVLTGYADFDFGVKSLSLGVSDYILKDDLTSLSLYKSILYSLERKKATIAFQESEKKYSDLFNLSPLPMWVVDLKTLRFLDVNEATVKNYGFSYQEFLSMTLKDIRPPDQFINLLEALALDRLNPDQPSSRVMIHKMKNGDLRNVEIQISPVLYKGDKANFVIATDITERQNYIKAIEEQNQRLKEISWIQSHIIRAPLSRIMGLVPLLANVENTIEERNLMLGFLTESADELDGVIKNITDKSNEVSYTIKPDC